MKDRKNTISITSLFCPDERSGGEVVEPSPPPGGDLLTEPRPDPAARRRNTDRYARAAAAKGITRPLFVICPTCGAAPGKSCDRRTLGRHAYHRSRVDASTRPELEALEEAMNEAITEAALARLGKG